MLVSMSCACNTTKNGHLDSVEWNGGLEWCNGIVEWTGMVEWYVDKLDDFNGFSPPYNDHFRTKTTLK